MITKKIEDKLSVHQQTIDEAPSIQTLRDEVRAMVTARRPADGIPLYQGRRGGDGLATLFLRKHYQRYLQGDGRDTLFMHDLRKIDGKLARAINTESSVLGMALGTKSAMIDAMAAGVFTEGPETRRRVRNTRRLSKWCIFKK